MHSRYAAWKLLLLAVFLIATFVAMVWYVRQEIPEVKRDIRGESPAPAATSPSADLPAAPGTTALSR
jgi:uncharacterized membrane protein